jgi:hypothetical protein
MSKKTWIKLIDGIKSMMMMMKIIFKIKSYPANSRFLYITIVTTFTIFLLLSKKFKIMKNQIKKIILNR